MVIMTMHALTRKQLSCLKLGVKVLVKNIENFAKALSIVKVILLCIADATFLNKKRFVKPLFIV
jgi:hypothetical protein